METGNDLESVGNTLIRSRVFAAFLILLSAWSLYSNVRHASVRFAIPHNLVIRHEPFGGWIDILAYIGFPVLLVGFVTSTRDKIEIALFVGMFGPIVINPLRMLFPHHTSAIWWVEQWLLLVLLVTSIIVFLRLIGRRSMPYSSSGSEGCLNLPAARDQ
jgi:hypothetical protein